MARRKRKRRMFRGAVLLGAAGGAAALARRLTGGGGGGGGAPQGPQQVVKPDDSAGDPLVEEQTKKAEAEAGSVGGNVQELAESEPGFPSDPEMRPVIEGSGDDPEAAEQADAELGGNRETRP